MPLIELIPINRMVEARQGTELLDVLRRADITVETPCGGKGACGKCRVRLAAGSVEGEDRSNLTAEQKAEGYVCACQCRVGEGSLTIEVPALRLKTGAQFAEAEFSGQILLPDRPLAEKISLTIPPPVFNDGLSDFDRLERAVKKQTGRNALSASLAALQTLSGALRKENGETTLTISNSRNGQCVFQIDPGNTSGQQIGLAVDLGTTTVAVQALDLATGQALGSATGFNDQISCGLDVISRIQYAKNPERLTDLRMRSLQSINRLVQSIANTLQLRQDEIICAAISGNTVMTHLLLGLPPEPLRLAPYTPTIFRDPQLTAEEIGLHLHPCAPVYFSPAVGSYVGGDILAGLLLTDLAQTDDTPSLFIDIGTNGEAVLGNRNFLMACACSAGPAFEGGGISCGLPAIAGAIEKVSIDPKTGTASISTVGGKPPQGICGSGMIDLVAGLLEHGWIDRAGKLDRSRGNSRIRIQGRMAEYVLVPENNGQKKIAVTEPEIENVIRAKAAIFAACRIMIKQAEIGFGDLAKIYIAGGFGRFLNLKKAIEIGLLPDVPLEKYHYLGNASLVGSRLVCLSEKARQKQADLAQRITYLELNTDPSYMDEYTPALFLPHTDLGLFSSAKASGQR